MPDGIDQAALRRFDLKLAFGYLSAEQRNNLLRSSCRELNIANPDTDSFEVISHLENATPGDFASCRRQAKFKNFRSPAEFAAAVAEECRLKNGQGGRKLGF